MTNAPSHPRGAVAAGHRLTAAVAARILADGGNAFDAVIAALAMACVAEPLLAAPGGGGFLMAREAGGEVRLYDFFAQTPLTKRTGDALDFHAIDADFGPATQEFHIGRGAAATPGLVPGLLAAHEALASMTLERLLAPAIEAARSGWRLNAFEAFLLTVLRPILTASEGPRALFAPEGELIGEGERFRNPGIAGFWERLAGEGAAFYDSDALRSALLEGQAEGGHLGEGDLETYRVERRRPLCIEVDGARLYLNPPPSAGGCYIAYQFRALAANGAAGPCAFARALAQADEARRRHGGDLDAILEYAGLAPRGLAPGHPAPRGTTHISVVDADGNAAALSASNGEGNGHIVGGFGFMLNNMLGEEDLNPGGFHRWRPGTRLSSMMAPAIVEEPGGGLIALGSGGSNRIRTAVFQVLARLVAGDLSPAEAVCAPRLHFENGRLDFEDDFPAAERRALTEAFCEHRPWSERNLYFGGVHAVRRDAQGRFAGAGDRRRAGVYAEA